MASTQRIILIGQSLDSKGSPKSGYWDIRQIKTIKDINNNDIEIYDGDIRSESYELLLNRKTLLTKELAFIQSKLDAINQIK